MEGLELFSCWSNKHVTHEESMVGTSTDNTDADSVSLIPASITVDNIDAVSGVQVVDSTFSVNLPDLYRAVSIVFTRRDVARVIMDGGANGRAAHFDQNLGSENDARIEGQ
jgi:hypothetical protein